MSTKTAIAYHEAGHAVMAVYCRMGLGTVSIVPGQEFRGICKTAKQPSLTRRDHWLPPKAEKRQNHRIVVTVAGDVAQSLYSRRRNPSYGSSSDHELVVKMASRSCGDMDELLALVNYLTISTRNLLRSPARWASVKALAKELLVKEEVSGRRAKEIVKKAEDAYYEQC